MLRFIRSSLTRRIALNGGGLDVGVPRMSVSSGMPGHVARSGGLGLGSSDMFDRVMLGGIRTARVTRSELADVMLRDVQAARAGVAPVPRVVIASNGSVIARYHSDPAFRALIDQADIVDPDGMPLVLFTRLMWKRPLAERVATTDFIHDAAQVASRNGVRFFFLGGTPGTADRAADTLRTLHPGLSIVGTYHGFFTADDEAAICAQVRRSGADVLWLGLGSPAQESFAIRYREALAGVAWIRTCGGLFDHYTGAVPRAPRWMQSIGLEWLHRTVLEPRRLGARYLRTNPPALWHLLTKSRETPTP